MCVGLVHVSTHSCWCEHVPDHVAMSISMDIVMGCTWGCGGRAEIMHTRHIKVKHSYREISQFNACLHNPVLVVVVRRLSDFSVLRGWHFSPLMYWYRFHSSARCLASPRSYHISGDNEPSRDIPDRGTPSYSPSTNKLTHLSWPAHHQRKSLFLVS